MPIFDYKCECGHDESDKLVKAHDSTVICPECGKPMTKQLSATKNLILKGDGFYKQHDAPNPNW